MGPGWCCGRDQSPVSTQSLVDEIVAAPLPQRPTVTNRKVQYLRGGIGSNSARRAANRTQPDKSRVRLVGTQQRVVSDASMRVLALPDNGPRSLLADMSKSGIHMSLNLPTRFHLRMRIFFETT